MRSVENIQQQLANGQFEYSRHAFNEPSNEISVNWKSDKLYKGHNGLKITRTISIPQVIFCWALHH